MSNFEVLNGVLKRYTGNEKEVIAPNNVLEIGMGAFACCPNLTIYAEAEKQPSGWDEKWNPDNLPVVWGHK